MGPRERELLEARGVTIEVTDLEENGGWPPRFTGYIKLDVEGLDTICNALTKPGLEEEQREAFAEWIHQLIDRFMVYGPDLDGWQRREIDGAWQFWCRMYQR